MTHTHALLIYQTSTACYYSLRPINNPKNASDYGHCKTAAGRWKQMKRKGLLDNKKYLRIPKCTPQLFLKNKAKYIQRGMELLK